MRPNKPLMPGVVETGDGARGCDRAECPNKPLMPGVVETGRGEPLAPLFEVPTSL